MIGMTLVTLLVPALAIHIIVLILESDSAEIMLPQHRLLRSLANAFFYLSCLGIVLFSLTSVFIVVTPVLLTLMFFALGIRNKVNERRIVSALNHATELNVPLGNIIAGFGQLQPSESSHGIVRAVNRMKQTGSLPAAVEAGRIELSLETYLDLVSGTRFNPQKTSYERNRKVLSWDGFMPYIHFLKSLRYSTFVLLFTLVFIIIYESVIFRRLDFLWQEYDSSLSIPLNSTAADPTLVSQSPRWYDAFSTTYMPYGIGALATIALMALIAAWWPSPRLWTVWRLGRWSAFGKLWKAITLQHVGDELMAGKSIKDIAESLRALHPIRKLKLEARQLNRSLHLNLDTTKTLQNLGWLPTQILSNKEGDQKLDAKLMGLQIQHQGEKLAQEYDQFWMSVASQLRLYCTLIVASCVLLYASKLVGVWANLILVTSNY